jgi:hypothetical protein
MDLISTASSAAIDENVDTPSEIYHHGDGFGLSFGGSEELFSNWKKTREMD